MPCQVTHYQVQLTQIEIGGYLEDVTTALFHNNLTMIRKEKFVLQPQFSLVKSAPRAFSLLPGPLVHVRCKPVLSCALTVCCGRQEVKTVTFCEVTPVGALPRLVEFEPT